VGEKGRSIKLPPTWGLAQAAAAVGLASAYLACSLRQMARRKNGSKESVKGSRRKGKGILRESTESYDLNPREATTRSGPGDAFSDYTSGN